MTMQDPPTGAAGVPHAVVHDAVAAIVRQSGYVRSLRSSLLQRLFRWLTDLFDRLTDAVGRVPHLRWWIIGAASAVVVLIMVRLASGFRARTGRAGGASEDRASPSRNLAVHAEQLAAQGRFGEAAQALYHALVETLGRRGQLRPHEGKTTGDYARELRAAGSPGLPRFRSFARRYDRVLFGHGSCDAVSWAALRDDARELLA